MRQLLDTTQDINAQVARLLSNNLNFQTKQILANTVQQEIAPEIQNYLEANFVRLVNDEKYLLEQVRLFLDRRYGLNLSVQADIDYPLSHQSDSFATPSDFAESDDWNNDWATNTSLPLDYWGIPFNSNHSQALQSFIESLANNQLILKNADIPIIFTQICQHLFSRIHCSNYNRLDLPNHYLAALNTLDLNQIILALFPQPTSHEQILLMSTIPEKLKGICYRKYLHWAKQSLQSLSVNTLWLPKSSLITLDPDRNWLLMAIAGVIDSNNIKPTLVGLQQTSLPQSQIYQCLLRQLKDRQLQEPQLIIHDDNISGQDIRAIFPNAYTWLVPQPHQSTINSLSKLIQPKDCLPIDELEFDDLSKLICEPLLLPSDLSANSRVKKASKKQITHRSNVKAVATKRNSNIAKLPQIEESQHDYVKVFHQLTRPMELLGLALQSKNSGRTSSLAMGILWQMLQLSIEQMSCLPISR